MSVPDNGPLLSGISWWLTAFCGAFLALRLYAKLSRKQGLWWDDHILITSWILLLAQAILLQVGQTLGFGKRLHYIPLQNLPIIAVGISVGATISCFASTLSKISFGVTLLRLTSGYLRWFVWFCIVTLFLAVLPSALSTWFQCTPMAKVWNDALKGTCLPAHIMVDYGIFNATWCAAVDFALALIPWNFLWGLQLKRHEKFGVGIAMSLGILSGVCAIVKGVYVIQLRSKDFSYDGKNLTIWTIVETATAIIAASIPVLRVFLKEAVSSYAQSHGQSNRSDPKAERGTPFDEEQGLRREMSIVYDQIKRTNSFSVGPKAERGIPFDEEHGLRREMSIVHDQIIRTSSFSVTVEEQYI